MNIIQNEYIFTNLIYTAVILIFLLSIRGYIIHRIHKKTSEKIQQYDKKKVVHFTFMTLSIFALLVIWYESSEYLVTILGFFSAGIAFSSRDLIVNMFAGLYIMWARPFKVGERIEIGGKIGDVIDINLMHFSMLEVGNRVGGEQSTGRMIHMPNVHVINAPLANYEKGFKYIWNEMYVNLSTDSDWEKAKEILYKVVESSTESIVQEAESQIETAGKKYPISYRTLTPMIYTKVNEGKIVMSVRYLCEPRKSRSSEHAIWESFLKQVKEMEEIKIV